MKYADNDIDSLHLYVSEAVEVHHGDAAASLAEDGFTDAARLRASVARYESALSVIEEYRQFLCRMSEVEDLAGSLDSVTVPAGGSLGPGQVH